MPAWPRSGLAGLDVVDHGEHLLQFTPCRRYAAGRGFEIVETYADQGKSGLKIEGRDALKRLLADVQAGRADFKAILVYDVSRWGRFQDADESA